MRRCSLITTIVKLVKEVVEPVVQEPYELVDIEYSKMGSDHVLKYFVDKPGGITVNDTAELTDIISPLLDMIKPDPFPEQYFLEVTSPGLERPLKTEKNNSQLQLGNISMLVCIKHLIKVKVFEGHCFLSREDHLTMEYTDETRKKVVQIPYQLVSKARLAVKF